VVYVENCRKCLGPMGHDLVRRKVYGTKDLGEETKYTIE
jgi:hypothetical protein